MLKYKILKGTSGLKQPCKEASLNEGLLIIDKLQSVLEKTSGIGLAANQIGILKRVCILRVPIRDSDQTNVFGINFINPVVSDLREPMIFENEGCLSFPGMTIKTLRYNKVLVKDLLEPGGRELTGLMAVCAQHECDHTNGKTMYDSLYSLFKDDSRCPCDSGKVFKNCCKERLDK